MRDGTASALNPLAAFQTHLQQSVDDKAAALPKKRPAWLNNSHRELDKAVAAAYGWTDWDDGLPDEVILERLFKFNQERATVA